LWLAEIQGLGHGGGHVDERRFAAFDKVEGARHISGQRQQVQGDDVFDVHVGPDVLPGADMTHHTALACLLQQSRQLHAVALYTQAVAVDQGVADHRRVHSVLRCREDQVVDRHAGRLVDGGCRQVVFEVDDVAGFSSRRIADDARSAGVQEHFVRPAQGVEQRFDGAAMVAAGGVDHGVSGASLPGQQRAVFEGADHRGDAQCFQLIGLFGAAHQARDGVAGLNQTGGDGTADKTGGAGDEYFHGESLRE